MRRIWFLLITLLSTTLVSASPAQALPPTVAEIYNPAKIVRFDLTMSADSIASLNNQNTLENYVAVKLSMSVDKKTSGLLDVKVRLKGSTSLQKLDETPSFKIKFPDGPFNLGYQGLKKLTLNAMTQDGSKLHEYGAYALFNAVGVPAPRTGWARVYVNGVDKGLYVNVETPDLSFTAKKFRDITQHIYEGAGSDFWTGSDWGDKNTGQYEVDYGWKATPNKSDLRNLIAFASIADQKAWYSNLTYALDRSELIKFMAVENFLGHWDGYSGPDKNNYFIRSNTNGIFSFIPWGTDQTFGENRATAQVGDGFDMPMLSETSAHPWSGPMTKGMLYVKCIRYTNCKNAYLTALKTVAAKAKSMDLAGKLNKAAILIEPALQGKFWNTPGGWKVMDDIHTEQARTITWLNTRIGQVSSLLIANGMKP